MSNESLPYYTIWHAGLTSGESDLLEQIQKRALRIIYPDIRYIDALDESAHLEQLCSSSGVK